MRTLSLTGTWEFAEIGTGNYQQGDVPGGVYSDLLAEGEIADPYEADNELDLQWVARSDWVYRRTVELDGDLLDHEEQRLVCHGLDTVATVEINGVEVGHTDNMHRRYEFDVNDALEPGKNEIRVTFESPVEYGVDRQAEYPYEVPKIRYPHDFPARNFIRKAQCHYGWDWGPCLATMGIWREIELVGYSGPRITYTKSRQDHRGEDVTLSVDVGVDVPSKTNTRVSARVADAETTEDVVLEPGDREVTLVLSVEDPDRWWPNGYGDQPLYDLKVVVDGGRDTATDRVGFREVELVREADDGGIENDCGESFYFEVNGEPVFAKGANWIPVDALYGRIDRDAYADRLTSAVEANMNMVRVWGGGYYERDAFYELCDELGLLVWQDFMYACSLYPADDAFLDTAEAETRYQVRRLANHPSIALWCGNNENEEALYNWFADRDHAADLAEDYERLFVDTIGEAVREEDPSRAYWSGSPSSGEDWDDPYMTERGDIHYWDVWHKGAPFEDYEETEPRLVSEFGYQSFPSTDLLRTVLPETALNPTSPLMEHHQRNEGGNGRILTRMTDHFRVPFSFEDFVYLSQVQQSMAMQTAVEHWRRLDPHTRGALYWQLNDLWPCASWSSLEYGGDWKALQYVARRMYAPVLVSTTETDDGVEVWLSSDETDTVTGTVSVEVMTVDGEVSTTEQFETTLAPHESTAVTTVDRDGVDRHENEYFVRASFDGPVESYDACEFFVPYKAFETPDPDIDVTVDGSTVTLSTDTVAFWVALDVDGVDGVFSDNYFHLVPGEERTITLESTAETDDIEAALERADLTHLGATY